jgi:hypothetical protein
VNVVNPGAIGDRNQTPVVYLGEANGKALGIRQRTAPESSSPVDREPPEDSVVHVDYYDEHGIILRRYPKGWTEPGRDCDAPDFPGYMTWDKVQSFGATTLLVSAAALEEAQRDELAFRVEMVEACEEIATLTMERDEARSSGERMRQELANVGWSSVADLHAAYVDVLERWQRSEPVLEAAKAWRAKIGPEHVANFHVHTVVLRDAVDTYESQESTDG